MRRIRTVVVVMATALLGVGAVPQTVRAADPVPPFIPPAANWLDVVNYYRAMAGVNPVTENTTWSQGAFNHSCYMLYNGITHDEIPGKLGYTSSGDLAGNNGNVAVSSSTSATARNHIELWMTGPFHAIGVLRHNLSQVGYGQCTNSSTSPWKSGATLDVLRGLAMTPRPSTPILFPGNGTTTSLTQFVTESPNPLTYCGWSGPAGLPVIAMMPEAVNSASATMVGPNGPVQTCRLYAGNTDSTAQAILRGDNAVTVIPRNPLTSGVYTVTVTTQARTVQWSFTVDPVAATGVMPVPSVSPVGPASKFTSVAPFRFADSRTNNRITKLLPNTSKRIRVAGQVGMPMDITSISATFTVATPTGGGWLTVYNCSPSPPTASTLNFAAGEAVANSGVFPLGGDDICVISPVEAQLVIDINGYFRPTSTNGFTAIAPEPLIDTTTDLEFDNRLAAGETIEFDMTGGGNAPNGATAVALNIAGINPAANGWITAYPCGGTMPIVSSVNPTIGTTKQSFAIVPLPEDGRVCFYASTAMDIRVELLGYFTDSGDGTITPTTPTRVIDTRDKYRSEMNLGTGGSPLAANTTKELLLAGQRGIPSSAKALSVNLTIVLPQGAGVVTIWGCGSQPPFKTITYSNGKTVANGVQVDIAATGKICVKATTTTHLIVDVTGYWS